MDHKFVPVQAELKTEGDQAGQVSAVFSTFGVVDHDGDIVEPSAFTEGQKVPMAWGHDWRAPVGKGVIHVTPQHAEFDGAFFVDTEMGLEAYKSVKAMGDLQEWSWGFRVLDAAYEQQDEEYIRRIQKVEVFEVSPVLKGAGIGTYTAAIKAAGMTYADQSEMALAAVTDWLQRTKSLADLRAEGGRTLSDRHVERLTKAAESLAELQAQIDEVLKANRPAPTVDVGRLLVEFQRTRAALSGVAL